MRSVQEGPQISDVIGTGHKVMVAETKDKRAVDVVFGCNRNGRYPVLARVHKTMGDGRNDAWGVNTWVGHGWVGADVNMC